MTHAKGSCESKIVNKSPVLQRNRVVSGLIAAFMTNFSSWSSQISPEETCFVLTRGAVVMYLVKKSAKGRVSGGQKTGPMKASAGAA
jgi:hypothetical protein